MRQKKWLFRLMLSVMALALVACACPATLPFTEPNDKPVESEAWQEEVDAIKTMTRTMTIPGHLLDPEKPVSEDVFDPNRLLEPLDHLSLRSGYTLDFIYRDDGIGANPILYARKEETPPYERYEDLETAMENCEEESETLPCDYLEFVETDGTEAGYFQWVLLRMMGDQFYLYWHANYNDTEIIASRERLQALVDSLSEDEPPFALSGKQQRAALRINPAPAVTIEEDLVTVRVVWFTKWGGFFETIYTIDPDIPHRVIDLQSENLVEYDCGIMF